MPLQPFQNQNLDLRNYQNGIKFQAQIANFLNGLLNQVQNGQSVAQTVAGQLTGLNPLGSVSTNQTVPCANQSDIMISASVSAAITITMTNLIVGSPVWIRYAMTATATQKLAATNPSGTAYAIFLILSSGAVVNMVTTGSSLTNGDSYLFFGNSVTESGGTPTLYLASI
jgi:hypothetical protein